MIKARMSTHPVIMVTYFKPDLKKKGGAYVTIQGSVKKIDGYTSELTMMDGEKISVEDIMEIEGEMFREDMS